MRTSYEFFENKFYDVDNYLINGLQNGAAKDRIVDAIREISSGMGEKYRLINVVAQEEFGAPDKLDVPARIIMNHITECGRYEIVHRFSVESAGRDKKTFVSTSIYKKSKAEEEPIVMHYWYFLRDAKERVRNDYSLHKVRTSVHELVYADEHRFNEIARLFLVGAALTAAMVALSFIQ